MNDNMSGYRQRVRGRQTGFTLVELLVAMAVSAVALTAMINIYGHMQSSSTHQMEMAVLQQNQRGALDIMEREFRMIGMDRNQSRQFYVTDVRRFSIDPPSTPASPQDAPTGSPILRMQVDLNSDGVVDANETVTYSLFDKNGDGLPPWELSRSTTMPGANSITQPQMLAEGVEKIGFAYAFDADGDGRIDRKASPIPGGDPVIIWAVDSDNDGNLDAEPVGTSIIGVVRSDGTTISQAVRPQMIRSVQFWILGRTLRPDPEYADTKSYSIGDEVFTPKNEPNPDAVQHYRRWLLTEVIHCRNL